MRICEGQENNQIIQELVTDTGWKSTIWNRPDGSYIGDTNRQIKKTNWLNNYALNCYKLVNPSNNTKIPTEISNYLKLLTADESAFSASTRGPLFEWERNPKPRSGRWNPSAFSDSNTTNNDNLLAKSNEAFKVFLNYATKNFTTINALA